MYDIKHKKTFDEDDPDIMEIEYIDDLVDEPNQPLKMCVPYCMPGKCFPEQQCLPVRPINENTDPNI